MLTMKDRIIILWACNALQYSLLECIVVIRESFLFRYSTIRILVLPCKASSHTVVIDTKLQKYRTN